MTPPHVNLQPHSIATKLFLLAIGVGALLTVISASVQLVGEYRSERQELEAYLAGIGDSYLPALSLSVFNFEL
ncbi:MAG: hypothetical protein ACLFPO_11740, partial [Spirochaetaceae bacterium]